MKEELFRPKELKRQRVNDCLVEAVKLPLCIVQASAGMGKKTAVRDFLEETEVRYFWYSLKENEYDDEKIWKRITELLDQEVKEEVKEFLGIRFPKTSEERQNFIHQLSRSVRKETIVVIEDGCQENHSEEFSCLLEDIAEAELEHFHIIIICEKMPGFRCGKLILDRKCNVIRKNILGFTEEEIGTYFKDNGIDLSFKERKAIYQYTEGWTAVISLILLDYVRTGKLNSFFSAWNFMKELVFDSLSEVECEIMMRLSPLENFTLQEAVYVTQIPECGVELQNCALETNFMEYDMVTRTFRLHHLLRLIAEKEYTDRGNSIAEIQKRSAMWYEGQGRLAEAIGIYIKIGETEEVFRVLETENTLKIYKSVPQIFKNFFKNVGIEQKIVHLKAYLIYIYYCEVYGDKESARKDFEKTERWFWEKEQDKFPKNQRILGEMRIMRSIMCIDEIGRMTKNIQEAYELLEGRPSEIFDEQFMAFYMVPELYGIHYSEPGKLRFSIEKMKEFSRYYFPLINAKDSGWEWMAEGEYYYLMGNVQKAAEIGEIAFQKACFRKKFGAIISTAFLKMKCCIYLGSYTELVKCLEKVEEVGKDINKDETIVVLYDLVNGYIHQCMGDASIAEWLKNYEIISYNNYFKTICAGSITYGKILMDEGRYAQLTAIAEDMMKYQERSSSCYLRIKGGIYLVIAKYHLFGEDVAKEELERVLKVAQKDELVGLFMENAGELLPVLKLVQDEEINREYLKKVIFHCQQYQSGINLILNKGEGPKEAGLLTERELEILQLVKTGYKNGEIGKTLNIATVTVEKALSNIYRKLNVKGRVEAVKKLDKIL